jgi:hypothetical protein
MSNIATSIARVYRVLHVCTSVTNITEWTLRGPTLSADLIVRNGCFTTLDRSNAAPVAIIEGVFRSVGRDQDVMPLASSSTRIIDKAAACVAWTDR